MMVHDRFGNCVPLGAEPPPELTRLGQDLNAAVAACQKSRGRGGARARGPRAADPMQALVAEVEQLEAKAAAKARSREARPADEVRRRIQQRRALADARHPRNPACSILLITLY